MIISAIVAASLNHVIGIENRLPWKLSADLAYFKKLTMGHHLLMGRKTFESIGKALPGRISIVLSKGDLPERNPEGVFFVSSPEEAIALAEQRNEQELFVIGGGQIYSLMQPFLHRIYLTRVEATLQGDTFFPNPEPEYWHCIDSTAGFKDEKNEYNYQFLVFERR